MLFPTRTLFIPASPSWPLPLALCPTRPGIHHPAEIEKRDKASSGAEAKGSELQKPGLLSRKVSATKTPERELTPQTTDLGAVRIMTSLTASPGDACFQGWRKKPTDGAEATNCPSESARLSSSKQQDGTAQLPVESALARGPSSGQWKVRATRRTLRNPCVLLDPVPETAAVLELGAWWNHRTAGA